MVNGYCKKAFIDDYDSWFVTIQFRNNKNKIRITDIGLRTQRLILSPDEMSIVTAVEKRISLT